MVYTGKPSKGCGMCKSRRIKCDEKRPICSQCQKSGRACPGYPDEFDLMFRDENKALAKKARKGSGRSEKSQESRSVSPGTPASLKASPIAESASSQAPPTSEPSQTLTLTPPSALPSGLSTCEDFLWHFNHSIPPTIVLAPEFEAISFFFRNFITLPQEAESMRGYLELLVPLYNRAQPSSALHLATSAVALATCGNYPGRQHLLHDAATTYGKAIRKLKEDLKHPHLAKSDESVLATLLFSLYEVSRLYASARPAVTIMSTDDTITAWGNHVDGAVALTKLRGTEQFDDPMSHDVFRAVRTMMITSCVQRSKPIETFPGTTGWLASSLEEENAANRLTLICIDLPNIRSRANTLTKTAYHASLEQEALSILEFAQLVDSNLQRWYLTLSPEWHHHTIGIVNEPVEDLATAESWMGEQHVYHDVPLASIVNDYRVCRIFCMRVIMACVAWLAINPKHNLTADYEKAVYAIQQMVDEISACIPFHMNYDLQPIAKKLGQEKNAAEAYGGYSLVWPLYVAANAETVPQAQRDWLSGRLMMIGTRFGLTSAQVLVLARRHVLTCGPMFP
ncbi:White-opaque regulator 1-like protein 1 [Paraphaeosphaeria minitans]|uniref:White-opaque regulator 1-like protein 1 n=1 Tax=Paraphaeosphaeria minitans TaxID=565426 RepID=A0A9P6GFM6_9PLEO|nr:White-opaque regulator 1-like protein 1 [Paraphaeosphaeria minitans]